jgi:hypothetical protein
MVQGTLFIGALITGITQWLKLVTPPEVSGHWIIVIAAVVGAIIGLVDIHIGVVDITVAQGILIGLGAAGVTAVAEKVG